MNEFEKAYAKNVGNYELAAKDSFNNYKNQEDKMKKLYLLIEKYVVEPVIKDWYEKRKTEIRASHIMFKPDKNGDWTEAEKMANNVLDSIKHGAKSFDIFSLLSKEYVVLVLFSFVIS